MDIDIFFTFIKILAAGIPVFLVGTLVISLLQ